MTLLRFSPHDYDDLRDAYAFCSHGVSLVERCPECSILDEEDRNDDNDDQDDMMEVTR